MTIVSEFFGENVYDKRYATVSFHDKDFVVKYYDDSKLISTYSTLSRQTAESVAEEYVLGYMARSDPDFEYQGGVEYFG